MTRRRLIIVASCACVLLPLFAADTRSPQRSTPASRPNVILIMTDDIGYADLGSYGGTDIKTPILDRLARDGLRLTDAYGAIPTVLQQLRQR